MQRVTAKPRADWEQKVEKVGLVWHSAGGAYWNESAYFEFTAREIDELEAVTNELHQLALGAVQHVIDEKLYDRLDIPPLAVPLIEHSWEAEPPSLYGRFDLAYDGVQPPKLLEYNADTPTSLLEAAVVQWYWLQDCHPQSDQFNSLHERLVACWKEFQPYLSPTQVHFCAMDDNEDGMTITYLRETAEQAGLRTIALPVQEIGWSEEKRAFVGENDEDLHTVMKLYPWEWLVREEFAPRLVEAEALTQWIEPAWKMVLSNKGLLPILWELNPGHPNLLPAYFDSPRDLREWVSKPLLGREGANIEVSASAGRFTTPGEYGVGARVFQQYAALRSFDGRYPVLGSWIIGQEAGGLGVREAATPVTTNTSQFVPHLSG